MAATALQQHLVRQVLAHQDEIAPELMDYIGGTTEAEIDASIELAKQSTAGILARAQQQQFRPDDADIFRFQVEQGYGETLLEVGSMSMDEYGAYRRQHLGLGR